MGSWIGTGRAPRRVLICSSAPGKSAPARSILLTKPMWRVRVILGACLVPGAMANGADYTHATVGHHGSAHRRARGPLHPPGTPVRRAVPGRLSAAKDDRGAAERAGRHARQTGRA